MVQTAGKQAVSRNVTIDSDKQSTSVHQDEKTKDVTLELQANQKKDGLKNFKLTVPSQKPINFVSTDNSHRIVIPDSNNKGSMIDEPGKRRGRRSSCGKRKSSGHKRKSVRRKSKCGATSKSKKRRTRKATTCRGKSRVRRSVKKVTRSRRRKCQPKARRGKSKCAKARKPRGCKTRARKVKRRCGTGKKHATSVKTARKNGKQAALEANKLKPRSRAVRKAVSVTRRSAKKSAVANKRCGRSSSRVQLGKRRRSSVSKSSARNSGSKQEDKPRAESAPPRKRGRPAKVQKS